MPTFTPNRSEALDLASLFGLVVMGIVACVLWYVGYVRPRDTFLREVTACTQDGGRAEYARCSGLVRTQLEAQE